MYTHKVSFPGRKKIRMKIANKRAKKNCKMYEKAKKAKAINNNNYLLNFPTCCFVFC